MRKGIHRGYKSKASDGPRRAWVAEAPGEAGEWLSESDYRVAGYTPDFDDLPVKVVEVIYAGPVELDDLPEADREFVQEYMDRNKNT